MGEHEEFGVKLVLDDLASEGLKKIREGFEGVKDRALEAGREMLSMAKQAAAFSLGFQLNSMVDSMKDFGEEVEHAAASLQDQNRELAGTIAMVSRGHAGFEELTGEAGELNERLARVAVQTGNTKAAMLDAFTMIAEKSNKGAEHVEDMVSKMADASKTLPGGIASMGAAWRDLETGIIRPRNALVQLMRQMGVAEGSSKTIAKGLGQMIQNGEQEKVFALAEEAIDRMAKKTRDMPMTFNQLMTGLGTFREGLFEAVGTPIVKVLGREATALQKYFEQNRGEIEELARTIGERVGHWVEAAARMIQQGFQFLRTHADDIMGALEGGAKALRGAIQFLVDHRALILALAASQAVGGFGGLQAGAQAVGGIASGIGGAIQGIRAGAATATMGGALSGAATAIGPQAAFMAMVGAWALAADQARILSQETGLSFWRVVVMGGKAAFQASDRLQNFNAKMAAFEHYSDASSADLERFITQMERSGQAAVRAGDMTAQAFDQSMSRARRQLEDHVKVENAMNAMQAASANIFGSGGVGAAVGLSRMTSAFREASEANQEEAIKQARGILAANEQLRVALGALGVEDALKRLKGLAEGDVNGGEVKLPPINFGPSTFHISQDFREQDPDRVLVMFRRDLARNATSRVGSRLAPPFGF